MSQNDKCTAASPDTKCTCKLHVKLHEILYVHLQSSCTFPVQQACHILVTVKVEMTFQKQNNYFFDICQMKKVPKQITISLTFVK